MARRGGGGGGGIGGGGMMAPVLSIATGLIIFVVLIIFAPTIAGSIEDANSGIDLQETCYYTVGGTNVYGNCNEVNTTGTYDNLSHWNSWNQTKYPDIPTGVDLWTTNIQILGVVILIVSIAVAMYFLKGMA